MFKKGDQEVLSEMDQSSYSKDRVKIVLSEKHMPTHWYNICSDLPTPLAPPLNPGTGEPIGPEDLAPLFPMKLIISISLSILIILLQIGINQRISKIIKFQLFQLKNYLLELEVVLHQKKINLMIIR